LILRFAQDTLKNMGFRLTRQIRDRLRDESGQSIILISVVILSFLMFFSFAINTGLLINAKISVQSAADAAAYAGAATQARQLNAISFLNYDMRRQYKKFMFRYAFIGSMGSNQFPEMTTQNPGPNADYDFEKLDYSSGKRAVIGLNVPVVCIPLTSAGTANDNCVFVNMKSTAYAVSVLSQGGNAIQNALVENLKNVEALQKRLCTGQGEMNLFVLMAWLFRADTSASQVTNLLKTLSTASQSQNPTADVDAAVRNIEPLIGGLGLYPRNIINLMRIETLKGLINEKHVADIDAGQVDAWEKDTSVSDAKERSIQAFRSALANLNTTVFDPTLLKMDELEGDHLIDTTDVLINFNAYVQRQNTEDQTIHNSGGVTICGSSIDPFPVIGAPVGVKLNGPAQVNYAIHLKAFIRPHGLLYLPNSDPLELDAYAGAKPFGSRIGPAEIGQGNLTKRIPPATINGATPAACDGSTQADCYVPYLKVGDNKSSYALEYLKDLVKKAKPGKDYTSAGIQLAQLYAMAPTPEEVGRYNITPPGKDDMRFDFIRYATSKSSTEYRFYAPIFPAGKADVSGKVNQFMDKIFAKTQVSENAFGIQMNDMRVLISGQITNYITNAMTNPQTSERGETQTFASIELPMPAALKPGSNFWLTEASQVTSSWAPTYGRVSGDADGFGFSPRFGYSVKFVTLRDLQGQGLSSDDDDVANVSH
jgi:hypothetical protein